MTLSAILDSLVQASTFESEPTVKLNLKIEKITKEQEKLLNLQEPNNLQDFLLKAKDLNLIKETSNQDILVELAEITKNPELKLNAFKLSNTLIEETEELETLKRNLKNFRNLPKLDPIEQEIIKNEEEIDKIEIKISKLKDSLNLIDCADNGTVHFDLKQLQDRVIQLQDQAEQLNFTLERKEREISQLKQEQTPQTLSFADLVNFKDFKNSNLTISSKNLLKETIRLISSNIEQDPLSLAQETIIEAMLQRQELRETASVLKLLSDGPKPLEELKSFLVKELGFDSKDALKFIYSLIGKQLLFIDRSTDTDLTCLI